MAPAPGTFVLMGSGETTPTMVTVHQRVVASLRARVGRDRLAAALLDTPYGFQSNALEISEKARHYFAHNVGIEVDLLTAADLERASAIEVEGVLDAVRRLDWVFAGPGSPTYASRQWSHAPVAEAFATVVRRGGATILSSAAAVTAGEATIPVYEIYKAGAPAAWAPGLGVVRTLLDWPAVVIPHFDNAEGGTHDTRFCYLGEQRLTAMEADLDRGTWILGIDEHTAAVMDVGAGTLSVQGRGGVHVRRHGEHLATFATGTTVDLGEVESVVAGRLVSGARTGPAGAPDVDEAAGATSSVPGARATPFVEQVDHLTARFEAALEESDARTATGCALELESAIRAWSADTVLSADTDHAVTALRGMITRLGQLAADGLHDHTELVRPLIESMLHVRDDARARQAFEVADHIRTHMDADGVHVRDTRDGTEWDWREPDADLQVVEGHQEA